MGCKDYSTRNIKKEKGLHMSDSYLKIISTNPDFSPSLANQKSMQLLLSKHYPSEKIEVVTTDSV